MQILNYPKARSLSCDLAYTIYLAMGGDPNNIKQVYSSNLDDLLFAILTLTKTVSVTLPLGQNYYDVEANTILKVIWFQGGSAANIGVGNTAIDTNIFDVGALPNGGDLVFEGVKAFRNATRIYLNGVQPDTQAIIFKLN